MSEIQDILLHVLLPIEPNIGLTAVASAINSTASMSGAKSGVVNQISWTRTSSTLHLLLLWPRGEFGRKKTPLK